MLLLVRGEGGGSRCACAIPTPYPPRPLVYLACRWQVGPDASGQAHQATTPRMCQHATLDRRLASVIIVIVITTTFLTSNPSCLPSPTFVLVALRQATRTMICKHGTARA